MQKGRCWMQKNGIFSKDNIQMQTQKKYAKTKEEAHTMQQ